MNGRPVPLIGREFKRWSPGRPHRPRIVFLLRGGYAAASNTDSMSKGGVHAGVPSSLSLGRGACWVPLCARRGRGTQAAAEGNLRSGAGQTSGAYEGGGG